MSRERVRPAVRQDGNPAVRQDGIDPAGREHGPRRPAVDVVVVVATLALALLPLLPVFGVQAVLLPVGGGLVLGAAVGVVGARRRWSGAVTAAAALVVYLGAGPALAVPATAVAGVLPTAGSVAALLRGAVTVWKEVLTLVPPLGAHGDVLVAPFLLALVGAVTAVSVALRGLPGRPRSTSGAWAALVPPAVLATAVLLGTDGVAGALTGGVFLTVLLLLWSAWRRRALATRRPAALVTMVAVVVGAGAVGGPWLADQRPRLVLREELVPPFDPRDHASPLSSFRAFVRDWQDTDIVTVRGLPEGAAVRLATMDAFDGVVWDVAGAEAAEGSGEFRRVGDRIDAGVQGPTAEVEMVAHHVPGVWLPTVGYAERIRFGRGDADLAAALRYNDATGTAVLTDGVPAGTRWSAEVVVPAVPDDDEIGSASAGAVPLPEPRRVPDAVATFAGELAGTASTPVLVARSLEAGLAERGWFSHGITEAGDHPSLSGHGADRVTTLLTGELMVGDSEQYASAMALMARQMGLPARVVLGLVPDDEEAGAPEITLTGADAQAWVEVHFAGTGWVPFHPTPDESRTPRQDTPQDRSQAQPQVVQPPPPPEDPVRPPQDDTEPARTQGTGEEPATDDGWDVRLVGAAVGVPLLLVLAPLVLVTLAKAARRRRRRSAGTGVDRVVGGWDEVLDHARDLRRPAPSSATRRETARHLAATFGAGDAVPSLPGRSPEDVHSSLTALAVGADAVVFGPGEPAPDQVDAYWVQVETALAAMRSAVPRRERWRARWAPGSLRRRDRPARRRSPRGRIHGPRGQSRRR